MIGIGLPELLVILIQLLFWAGVIAIPVMLICVPCAALRSGWHARRVGAAARVSHG